MNSFTPNEIISHLEIYGDNHDGNIIRALNDMKQDVDQVKYEMDAIYSYASELEDCQFENKQLQDEIFDLKEKIEKLEGKK